VCWLDEPGGIMRFTVPLFGSTVIRFTDRAAMARQIKRMGLEAADDSTYLGQCTPIDGEDGRRVYLVGWYDRSAGTLVHECVHLALMVLERAGIDPRNDSGETLAYLTDYLFTRLKTR
jgi:hypothetical protein